MIAVGIWAASRVERTLGAKDPGVIVVDEVAGMLVSVLAVPRTPIRPDRGVPPLSNLRRLEAVPGPPEPVGGRRLGVMLDDLIAGAYALAVLVAARALLGAVR